MKQIRGFALCLAILGVAVPTAADVKSFHGAFCEAETLFSGASVKPNALWGVTVSGGGAYIVCPLVRDRINSSTSLTSVTAEVYIPSGGGILCTLYSQTEDGSAGSFVDTDSEERYTAGEGQMSYAVDSTNGNEGTYGLFCDMSDGTSIRHIQTNESNSATD